MSLKALTATRLTDGEVVFWTGQTWSDSFAAAHIFVDDFGAQAAEAEAKARTTLLVDPYLIEVATIDDRFAPVSFRERLRALGPTNRPDHGKQARGGEDIAVLVNAEGAARSKGRVDLIRRK
jgi:hypothetical protein